MATRVALSLLAASFVALPLRAQSTIDTDRPGFLFASTTVPEGMLQVELGLPSIALDSEGSDEARLVNLPVQLRYGWSERFELRLGAPLYNWSRVESGSSTARDDGVGDVEVGFKYALPEIAGSSSAAFLTGVRLPTGDEPFRVADPALSVNAVASWTVFEDMTFKGLAGFGHTPVHDGPDVDGLALGGLLGRSLGDDLSGYVEAAYFPADGAPDTSFAGFGLAQLLSPDAQLDLSVDLGLNEDATDWIFGVGYSQRF